jgi:FKBP-type peptidyl-prolyl cis-trans isomerase FkpA
MKRQSFRIAYMAAAAVIAFACNNEVTGLEPPSDPATETFATALNVDLATMTKLPSGVYLRDDVVGPGDPVTSASDSIRVSYAGYLKTGTLFETGTNVLFMPALLIQGMKEGVIGMKVGGRRRMIIPSALGYGAETKRDVATGKISIPRQSTLIFDVTLLKVHTPAPTTP